MEHLRYVAIAFTLSEPSGVAHYHYHSASQIPRRASEMGLPLPVLSKKRGANELSVLRRHSRVDSSIASEADSWRIVAPSTHPQRRAGSS